jgi:hypothetical protein
MVVAILLGILLVPPSRADLRESAADLVPPRAEISHQGENTGSELVSGQYFASVAFTRAGVTSDELEGQALAQAQLTGWEVVRVDTRPNARETWLRRGTMTAELFIPFDWSEGEFHVYEDRRATFTRVAVLAVGAPTAVLAGAALISYWRQRRASA